MPSRLGNGVGMPGGRGVAQGAVVEGGGRCDAASLEAALCGRSMVTMNEVILKTLDPEAAATSRDTLAKTIYSQLFDWWGDAGAGVWGVGYRGREGWWGTSLCCSVPLSGRGF